MKTLFFCTLMLLQSQLLSASEGFDCSSRFTGFFEDSSVSFPELPYNDKLQNLGERILRDIHEASDINPNSALAKSGFSGIGKCFVVRLDDPKALAELLQMNFFISVIGLYQGKSATFYFRPTDDLITGKCEQFHMKYTQATLDLVKSAKYSGTYHDGVYTQMLTDALLPLERQLKLTKDQKFLLSIRHLYNTDGAEVKQLCAYPNIN